MADYIPLKDGEIISGTTLDSKFSALEAAINEVEGVRERTFDHYHGTTSVVEPNFAFETGARFMGHAGNSSSPIGTTSFEHSYSLGDALGDPVYPGPDSSTMASPTVKGWRVIGDSLPIDVNDTDNVQGRDDGKLQCTFGGAGRLSSIGDGFDQISGILVMLNVEVLFFHDPTRSAQPVGAYYSPSNPTDTPWGKFRAHFALQANVRTPTGEDLGWYNIKKTHRTLSMPSDERGIGYLGSGTAMNKGLATSSWRAVRGSMWKDISIRTCITDLDLSGGNLADSGELAGRVLVLKGLRAVVALEFSELTPIATPDIWFKYGSAEDGMGITLKAYSMTTLALSTVGV